MKSKIILLFILLLEISSSIYAQVLTKKEIADFINQIPDLIKENYVLNDKKQFISNAFS